MRHRNRSFLFRKKIALKRSGGFTLIELLVTLTIISILSAIGLVVYSSVLKQGRDAKKQSDLRSIQSALEQYNSDQGFYPAPSPNPLTAGNPLDGCTGNPNVSCSSAKKYFNTLPGDSDATTPYIYIALRNGATGCTNAITNQCNSYCITAKLNIDPNPAMTPPFVDCTYASGYNFYVSPP